MPRSQLSAHVELKPARSQVFVMSMTLIGAGSLWWSFYTLQPNTLLWIVPLLCGIAALSVATFCWARSQKDTDQQGASPTKITDKASGISLSADMRSLPSQSVKELFAEIVHVMANRRRLPEPDGLVGADLQPIPNSKSAAVDQVEKLNAASQDIEQTVVAAIEDIRSRYPDQIQSTVDASPRRVLLDLDSGSEVAQPRPKAPGARGRIQK